MKMRVISGTAKGRKLRMKDSLPIRPTSDKVKGAVFNILAELIPDCRFLDLFAGSGAMGIEAWSRGAGDVTFVEKDSRVFDLLQENLRTVGFATARCVLADFSMAISRMPGRQFDIIYADPPYQAGLYPMIMKQVAAHHLLDAAGILCLEHPKGLEQSHGAGWRVLQQKTYGDTTITFCQQQSELTEGV